MKYLIGMIVIIFSFIFSDLILRVLISYWYIITIALIILVILAQDSKNKFLTNTSQIVLKVFGIMFFVLILMLFMVMHGEKDSLKHNKPSITKELTIVIKNNQPCFYVEKFEGIDAYEIQSIGVNTELPPREWLDAETVWYRGSQKHEDAKKIFLLSTISNIDSCLPYGFQNNTLSSPPKKLQLNILYKVYMDGVKRSTDQDKDRKYGIWLYGIFYLSKNSKTGELEVHRLDDEQRVTWFKKMDEQNQSIQTKKGEK